jgi:hypothetical protein
VQYSNMRLRGVSRRIEDEPSFLGAFPKVDFLFPIPKSWLCYSLENIQSPHYGDFLYSIQSASSASGVSTCFVSGTSPIRTHTASLQDVPTTKAVLNFHILVLKVWEVCRGLSDAMLSLSCPWIGQVLGSQSMQLAN